MQKALRETPEFPVWPVRHCIYSFCCSNFASFYDLSIRIGKWRSDIWSGKMKCRHLFEVLIDKSIPCVTCFRTFSLFNIKVRLETTWHHAYYISEKSAYVFYTIQTNHIVKSLPPHPKKNIFEEMWFCAFNLDKKGCPL